MKDGWGLLVPFTLADPPEKLGSAMCEYVFWLLQTKADSCCHKVPPVLW